MNEPMTDIELPSISSTAVIYVIDADCILPCSYLAAPGGVATNATYLAMDPTYC